MANDREFIIQPLIADQKVVKLADIDPTQAYAQIGVYQAPGRQSGGSTNNYPSYVIPISELGGGGGGASIPFGVDTGIVNAYAAAITGFAFTDGFLFNLKITNTNTGPSTLNINSLGALPLVDVAGNPLSSGLLQANIIYLITYNLGINSFQVLGTANPSTAVSIDRIAKGTGTGITDSSWSVLGADLIPVTPSLSNIGMPSSRIAALYMDGAAIDYTGDLDIQTGITIPIRVMSTGEVGINNLAPTARLHVTATGNTTGQVAFQAESLSGFGWFRVYGDGTTWSQGLSNNTHLVNALAGNVSVTYDSPGIQYLEFKVGGSIKSQLINQTALTRFNQAAGQFWGVYGSDNNPYILFDETNKTVGVGIALPTARLHVKGADLLATTFSLKVENSAANLYSIANNGAQQWNTYFDGASSGIPNYQYTSSTGILTRYLVATGSEVQIRFRDGVGDTFIMQDISGFGTLAFKNRFQIKNFSLVSKLWMDNADGNIGIGAGYFPATAQLHVRGASATSADFSLKVENSAGGRILHTRNDGQVYIGPENCWLKSEAVLSPGELVVHCEQLIALESDTANYVIMQANGKILRIKTWHGGATNNTVEFAGYGAAGFESFVRSTDIGTTLDGFKFYIGSSAVANDTNFKHCFVNGNVHIGYDELVNTSVTKLTIRGRGTTSATFALKVQDSTTANVFYIDDAGTIGAAGLQTGEAGLLVGELYVDTAANILANGDLVVGRKV